MSDHCHSVIWYIVRINIDHADSFTAAIVFCCRATNRNRPLFIARSSCAYCLTCCAHSISESIVFSLELTSSKWTKYLSIKHIFINWSKIQSSWRRVMYCAVWITSEVSGYQHSVHQTFTTGNYSSCVLKSCWTKYSLFVFSLWLKAK